MRRVFLKYLIYHDLHSSVGQIVENGIFKMATSRHIGFRAPKNPAHTFTRDTLELSQMTRLYRFSKIPNNVIKQFTLTKTMSILLNYLRVLSVPDSFEHFQRSLVKKTLEDHISEQHGFVCCLSGIQIQFQSFFATKYLNLSDFCGPFH